MITFDTIGLSYDLSTCKFQVRKTIQEHIEKYSRYGLTTLFFEDKVSSVQVLFQENTEIKTKVDEDGFQIICEGDDIVTYKDKLGNKRTEKTRNLYKIPSWSYLVNMRKQNSNIKVEFSIPKYLYGHNLNLFPNKEYYNELEKDIYYSKFHDVYSKDLNEFSLISLNKFVNDFTRKVFGVSSFVFCPEVYRIDLSYNYRFKDNNSFEKYREVIKDFFRKVHKGRYTNYNDCTFAKVTKQYSVKIYDKSVEFQKHDLKELTKYFNDSRLKLSKHEIDKRLFQLENFSKNLFRCEISLRKTELKELLFKNAQDFNFDSRNIYLQVKPVYNRVNACMQSLILLKSYINVNYMIGDTYNMAIVDNRFSDVQKRTIRRFISKYSDYLNTRYFPIDIDFMTNDDSLYSFMCKVNRYVICNDDDTRINTKLIAKSKVELYNTCKKIETGYSFYLNKTQSRYCFNINAKLLSYGFAKLEKYVQTFSKPKIGKRDLLKFLRTNRKRIKDELGINSSTLLSFVVAKFSILDDPYFGYPKSSYFRHEKNLQRVIEVFKLASNEVFECMDLSTPFENTSITTQIGNFENLFAENRQRLQEMKYIGEHIVNMDFEHYKHYRRYQDVLGIFIKTFVDYNHLSSLYDKKGILKISPMDYFKNEFVKWAHENKYDNCYDDWYLEHLDSTQEYEMFIAQLTLSQPYI